LHVGAVVPVDMGVPSTCGATCACWHLPGACRLQGGPERKRDDVNIAITAGVTAGITESGVLTLMSPDGAPYFYAPEASAIWIALRQSDGDVHTAAAELKAAWETEAREVRSLIEQYVAMWQQAGLVCTLIVPGSG
jgi:hypothetical protein